MALPVFLPGAYRAMQITRERAGESGAAFYVALRNCTGRNALLYREQFVKDGALTMDRHGRHVLVAGCEGRGGRLFRAVFSDDEYGRTVVQEVSHPDGAPIRAEDFPPPRPAKRR